MSKTSILATLALMAAAAFGPASSAQAQFGWAGRSQTFVGAGGPVSLTPGAGVGVSYPTGGYVGAPGVVSYSSGYAGYAPAASAYSYPYSYYAAYAAGRPARNYVPLPNTVDFPYYGQAYGHPYDPWTWPYLANPGGVRTYYYEILK